ncbi:hypothetical protein [Streptomyces noursei]|uniref:Fibronectin type-III domain-containing protein n=1 Tax=Streptomyces noursei TaxID=1971 RepID=A0A2N8PFQ7_STRNR|nr:hypothetical protein [Streptomyces noursei]PNE39860.1 hypothetical protein AOB60_01605 [Streptomyces noursei]
MNAITSEEIRVIFQGGKINPPKNFNLGPNNTLIWTRPDGSDEQTTYELTYMSATDTKTQKESAKSEVTIPTDLRETRYHVTIRATKDNNYSGTPSPLNITAAHTSETETIGSGLLTFPYGMAAAGDNLYIAAGSSKGKAKIWKILTIDNTPKPVLVRDNISETYAMAAAGNTLYFSQFDACTVMQMPIDGSVEPTPVFKTNRKLAGMAVVDDFLYVAAKDAGEVIKNPTHGPASVNTVVRDLSKPCGVAAADGILYISEDIENGRVMKAFITGGTPTPFIEKLNHPTGLAVADGILYIAESGSGKVLMIPTAGGKASPVTEGHSLPVAVAVVNGALYIAEGEASCVSKAPRLWKLSNQVTG